jgi:hypothetical protein
MNSNKPNGGFPPININYNISKEKSKEISKKKSYKEDKLKIRNILSDIKVKPMIDLEENKSKINIIDNL